ncbi:hypothetical protein PCL_05960 [Purpureocillium lilacinum]|uniref:Uncharacterized protein n=1 Tax=Purpureocillium lilacinum TaxID=33203 RepID=A0A2U3ELE6_PURLI|nr:hypothetical protein PCL_05960 [Purpureocillium lilacinum]
MLIPDTRWVARGRLVIPVPPLDPVAVNARHTGQAYPWKSFTSRCSDAWPPDRQPAVPRGADGSPSSGIPRHDSLAFDSVWPFLSWAVGHPKDRGWQEYEQDVVFECAQTFRHVRPALERGGGSDELPGSHIDNILDQPAGAVPARQQQILLVRGQSRESCAWPLSASAPGEGTGTSLPQEPVGGIFDSYRPGLHSSGRSTHQPAHVQRIKMHPSWS